MTGEVLAELEGDEPGHITRIRKYNEKTAVDDGDYSRPTERERESWIPWRRRS